MGGRLKKTGAALAPHVTVSLRPHLVSDSQIHTTYSDLRMVRICQTMSGTSYVVRGRVKFDFGARALGQSGCLRSESVRLGLTALHQDRGRPSEAAPFT